MKKSTHWITIPEETIHTPVSDDAEKDLEKTGSQNMKNKLFWGAGFIVLMVASFALLAPQHFNMLLRGSLFDTTGLSEEDMKISLIPTTSTTTTETAEEGSDTSTESASGTATEEETTEAATTSTDTAATSTTADTAEEGAATTTAETSDVTQPEEKAISISVTPLTASEEEKEDVTDCAEDITCLLAYLADCTPSKVTHSYDVSEQMFKTDFAITGSDNGNCTLTAKFTESPETALTDQQMDCSLAKGAYTQDDLEKIFTDKDELEKNCTGDTADTLKAYLESLETAAAAATESEAIADLKKQIEALTKIIAEQQTRPAAEETTTTVQSPVVGTGFKVNTNRVSITPEDMLQKNLRGGMVYAEEAISIEDATHMAATTASATPQSGPSEVILIAFVLTFLGLVGWKFVRTFA